MNKIKTVDALIEIAKKDEEEAACYIIGSDQNTLAKEIYKKLFDFYDDKDFSGDVIFTWKSPSLVKEGCYIGRRDCKVENKIVIGNIFPNCKTNKKYSLNLNRNGYYGSFPHDYFDIYLEHVAKYAFQENVANIKEYYPLKRAITYEENMSYFKKFRNFKEFLKKNYLVEIWEKAGDTPFSDMEFEEFVKVSSRLMKDRGIQMLKKLMCNNT